MSDKLNFVPATYAVICGKDSGGFIRPFLVSEGGLLQNDTRQADPVVPTGTTQTINFNTGKNQVLDLSSASGDVTLTLNNPQAGSSYMIKIIQGATARDVILPSSVLVPSGSAPNTLPITAVDDAIDTLVLYYDGANYLAHHSRTYG